MRGNSTCFQDLPEIPPPLELSQLSPPQGEAGSAGIHCLWLQLSLRGALEPISVKNSRNVSEPRSNKNKNGCSLCLQSPSVCYFLPCVWVGTGRSLTCFLEWFSRTLGTSQGPAERFSQPPGWVISHQLSSQVLGNKFWEKACHYRQQQEHIVVHHFTFI